MANWDAAIDQLTTGTRTLVSLWGERDRVRMALLDGLLGSIEIVEYLCTGGGYPSVGRRHAPAIRLERAVRDLYGFEAIGSPDTRPWLKHLGVYSFLPVEGEGLHQIPVGPVHAGTIEPGHFRFTASGETVVRLEERLGYAHKGVDDLMSGARIEDGAKLAGRVSGDSTVAYAFAFARAIEQALGSSLPPRAIMLRALMAELERLANHFGDIGAICNDASFAIMHAHCGVLRERVLRASFASFGHRMMRDCIVPGGVSVDPTSTGLSAVAEVLDEIERCFPRLIEVYDETASLKDRTVGTGVLRHDLAMLFGAGGYIGRASGRNFDARRALSYAPYDSLRFDVPVLEAGDVNARVWIRIQEVLQSVRVVHQILEKLPLGEIKVDVETHPAVGFALVEGFRGDVFVWVSLGSDGTIERCHLRDPSWFQWPLLEAVIEGNIVADFPLCNKSFNCSYSGHDL